MPTVFTDAAENLDSISESLIKKHYPDLKEAKVTINYLWAHSDLLGLALKLHGYPCAAIVKINSYADRVEGKCDATIKIDKNWWENNDNVACEALIMHELEHLRIQRDKDGVVKRDDAGRPKLKMKLHDWEVGGFASVVKKYGDKCADAQQVMALHMTFKQLEFNFG